MEFRKYIKAPKHTRTTHARHAEMSTLLSEEDLNDFISPALACTKPTTFTTEDTGLDANGEMAVGKEEETAQKVSITLSDCLACSGCITSSEEIMLQRQSHTVFLDAMRDRDPETLLAISISPQSRINMATYFGLDIETFNLTFINFFQREFQARFVLGLQIGRNVSIQRTIDYMRTWRESSPEDKRPRLSGICPGFVIYTEKTKGELVPLLVDIKSPQQITGNLLKGQYSDRKIYHLCIMACFDKKLEAARPDSEGEVDCVITPKEFLGMIEDMGISEEEFVSKYRSDDVSLYDQVTPEGWDPRVHWSTNSGSSSGGWAWQYIRSRQMEYPGSQIVTIPGKNSNVLEYRLMDSQGQEKLASSSELSGFRNIQNLVRHLSQSESAKKRHPARRVQVLRKRGPRANTKKKKCDHEGNDDNTPLEDHGACDPFHSEYIEVNASPGGCINGGGLINVATGKNERKEYTATLETAYYKQLPMLDPLITTTNIPGEFHYKFHAVEASKDIVTVGNKW